MGCVIRGIFFERGGTRLFCGDVGQADWEEVDLITREATSAGT